MCLPNILNQLITQNPLSLATKEITQRFSKGEVPLELLSKETQSKSPRKAGEVLAQKSLATPSE